MCNLNEQNSGTYNCSYSLGVQGFKLINKFTKYKYNKDSKSNVYIPLYYLKYYCVPFSFDLCHNSELRERNVTLFLGKETGAQRY